MTLRLISGEGEVWFRVTEAARKVGRGDVAVAYFGRGGAKRLPLKRGSRLVVDASEATVKSGATCPHELLTLHRQGVAIYSAPYLHGKVFVFARRAFVGSMNNSASSAGSLIEAAIETTDPAVIADARFFVDGLCSVGRLGPQELRALDRLYKDPPARRQSTTSGSRLRRSAVWVHTFDWDEWPDTYERVAKREQETAERKRQAPPETHYVEPLFCESEPKWRRGDTVVLITSDANAMVMPPGRVIDIRRWSNGRATYWFTFAEHPHGNRCSYSRMVKSLGRGWRGRLEYDGKLPREHGAAVLHWWDRRIHRS